MSFTAEEFIRKVVEVSSAVGWQANIGAMETAGQIVSILAANPELLPRFMDEGWLSDGSLVDAANGCLTFLARNGSINTPANLRAQKGVQQ